MLAELNREECQHHRPHHAVYFGAVGIDIDEIIVTLFCPLFCLIFKYIFYVMEQFNWELLIIATEARLALFFTFFSLKWNLKLKSLYLKN